MKRLSFAFLALGVMSCGGGGDSAPPPAPPDITVSVSPGSATIPAGDTQQFTATVQNTTDTSVTWQVNNTAGGDSTVGTISTDGLYTAPLSPPVSGAVTVTAVSQADQSRSGSATVTIVFSNATLSGQYAFSFTGVDATDFLLAVGSFTADGSGNLTDGVEDLNERTGTSTSLPFTGTYSIGSDGRGSATMTSSQGTSNLRFVVLSNQKAFFIQFDTFAGGQGIIQRQDPSAFFNSALVGGYSFGLDGVSLNGPITTAGRFTLDGVGGIAAGIQDINDAGLVSTSQSFTGTYNVAANGRGTATLTGALGTLQFSFYVVSVDEVLFVSLDFIPAMIGTAERQQSPSFSNSIFVGDYAFELLGGTASGILAGLGRFTADGAGSIDSGVLDGKIGGSVFEDTAFTGTYSVSSNGRGTATLSTIFGDANIAFYMVSGGKMFFVEVDSLAVARGTFLGQEGRPFSNSSISGSFGFFIVGNRTAFEANLFALSGQLTADGVGAISGTVDANDKGALSPDTPFTGTYTISSNGRGVGTEPGGTAPLRFYVVSESRVLVGGVREGLNSRFVGTAEKQF
jgi:hypothetical protein